MKYNNFHIAIIFDRIKNCGDINTSHSIVIKLFIPLKRKGTFSAYSFLWYENIYFHSAFFA